MTVLGVAYPYLDRLPRVVSILTALDACVFAIVAAAAIQLGRRMTRRVDFLIAAGVAVAVSLHLVTVLESVLIVTLGALAVLGWRERPASGGLPMVLAIPVTKGLVLLPPLALAFLQIGLSLFGGGLAMIPILDRQLVGRGWLSTREFHDAITLSQLTPGPIATACTFVGYRLAGIAGALTATLRGLHTPVPPLAARGSLRGAVPRQQRAAGHPGGAGADERGADHRRRGEPRPRGSGGLGPLALCPRMPILPPGVRRPAAARASRCRDPARPGHLLEPLMPETLPGARPPRLHSRLLHLLKRVGRILGFTLLGLELLYLLAVNVVLNLPIIPKLIDGEDAGMSWSYAVSLYPGQAIVHGFFMRIRTRNIQFTLSIGESPRPLHPWGPVPPARFPHHPGSTASTRSTSCACTPHPCRGGGDGPQHPARAERAFPPFRCAAPWNRLRGPPKPRQRWRPSWTVHIEGVHVVVDEGWFEAPSSFTGQSAATGSFTLKPKHMVIVDGHWHSGRTAPSTMAMTRSSRMPTVMRACASPPSIPPSRRAMSPCATSTASSTSRDASPTPRGSTPSWGRPPLSSPPTKGSFELFFHFDRGQRRHPGRICRLQASNWQVGRRRYQVNASTARLDSLVSDIGGVPTSITSLDLGPYHVSRTPASGDPGGELLTGDGMVLRLISTKLDTLGPFFSDLAYEFVLHEARMSDLRRLNAYLPGTGNFEVLGGEGTISGDYISPADDDGHGSIDITANDAAIRLMRVRVGSDLAVHLDLTGVASDSERMVIVGARPIGAKGRIEGRLRIRRPDDLIAAFPTVGSSELSCDFSVDPLTVPELQKAGLLHFLSGKGIATRGGSRDSDSSGAPPQDHAGDHLRRGGRLSARWVPWTMGGLATDSRSRPARRRCASGLG